MSDILIKGMKMPVACFDCPCMQDLSNIDEEYYICAAIEHAPEITNKNNGRLPKCPIVEVHTPHGRLIDADLLEKVFNWEHVKDSNSEYAQALYQLGQVTIEAIQESPTVIEAEVSENA